MYNVGMKNIQYTIRAIPPKLDASLRSRSKETGKSLNEVTLEALAKGAGVAENGVYDDLDWIIGSKTLDKSFSDAQDWLDAAPKEIA